MDLSIIIPTYKPQAWLYECLNSINNQTLPKGSYEVLIVLNGPKDPYYTELEQNLVNFSQNNDIKLIYVSNAGVSNARNIGMESAAGDFIAFVDDDDILSPSYFAELLRISTQSQVGLSNMKCFEDGRKDVCFDDYISRNYKRMRSLSRISFLSARKHMSGPVCKVIHRDIALSQRFDVNFKVGEDGLYMFAISNQIKSFAVTSSDAIYYRRIRKESASNKNKLKTRLQLSVPIFIAYVKIWIKHPFDYDFVFFITRLISIIKGVIYSVLGNIK